MAVTALAAVDAARPSVPSRGSVLHGTGNCRPCVWFWKPMGCMNGQHCSYCHMCSDGEIKARRKAKVVAMRFNGRSSSGLAGSEEESEQLHEGTDPAWQETAFSEAAAPTEPIPATSSRRLHTAELNGSSWVPSLYRGSHDPPGGGHAADARPLETATHSSAPVLPLSGTTATATGASAQLAPLPMCAPPPHPPRLHSLDAPLAPPPPQEPPFPASGSAVEDTALQQAQASRAPSCLQLRAAAPTIVGKHAQLWHLPSSPKAAEAKVLLITRAGMLDAFELPPSAADGAGDACAAAAVATAWKWRGSRSISSPPALSQHCAEDSARRTDVLAQDVISPSHRSEPDRQARFDPDPGVGGVSDQRAPATPSRTRKAVRGAVVPARRMVWRKKQEPERCPPGSLCCSRSGERGISAVRAPRSCTSGRSGPRKIPGSST
mmetsp:Transcript_62790/g.141824  ORF Transcript_62790/g.141824 Transcript_62790/m.141824 type:complete len:435 (-) Transcript_62790:147-1451(-)